MLAPLDAAAHTGVAHMGAAERQRLAGPMDVAEQPLRALMAAQAVVTWPEGLPERAAVTWPAALRARAAVTLLVAPLDQAAAM